MKRGTDTSVKESAGHLAPSAMQPSKPEPSADKPLSPGYGRRWLKKGEVYTKGALRHRGLDRYPLIASWVGFVSDGSMRCSVPIDLGSHHRVLRLDEVVELDDAWNYTDRLHTVWVAQDSACAGKTVRECLERYFCKGMPVIFRRSLRSKARAGEPSLEEACASIRCGCGHHDVDPSGDLYAQHSLWVWGGTRQSPEYHRIEHEAWATTRGIGVSALQPILHGPDLIGDDVAPDLTDAQLRALRKRGVR